jgi:hypothetical protein
LSALSGGEGGVRVWDLCHLRSVGHAARALSGGEGRDPLDLRIRHRLVRGQDTIVRRDDRHYSARGALFDGGKLSSAWAVELRLA